MQPQRSGSQQPVGRTRRRRLCARDGCDTLYEVPEPWPHPWPRRFCSTECHRLDKPQPARKPTTSLRHSATTAKRKPVSVASTRQRAAVKDRACVVCARGPVDPAHLLPRGLADDGDGDPRAVVPLCRECHREYDTDGLSLLEHLEPRFRSELAFAVERVGLLRTLKRVTNLDWVPIERTNRAA